jgi:hypothetical protein
LKLRPFLTRIYQVLDASEDTQVFSSDTLYEKSSAAYVEIVLQAKVCGFFTSKF